MLFTSWEVRIEKYSVEVSKAAEGRFWDRDKIFFYPDLPAGK